MRITPKSTNSLPDQLNLSRVGPALSWLRHRARTLDHRLNLFLGAFGSDFSGIHGGKHELLPFHPGFFDQNDLLPHPSHRYLMNLIRLLIPSRNEFVGSNALLGSPILDFVGAFGHLAFVFAHESTYGAGGAGDVRRFSFGIHIGAGRTSPSPAAERE